MHDSCGLVIFLLCGIASECEVLNRIVIYGAYQVSHMKHATADKNMIGDVMQFVHFPVWNFDLLAEETKIQV